MQTAVIESSLTASETSQVFAPGSPLFLEGDEPRGVYVIRSGEVDLLCATRDGKVKPLHTASSVTGQILGLSTVVTHRPHDCSAIAHTLCEVGFIDQAALFRALEETPSLWFHVLRILSTEVNAAYDEMRARSRR